LPQIQSAQLFNSSEGLALVEVIDLGLVRGLVALSFVINLDELLCISFQILLYLTLLDYRRRLLLGRFFTFAFTGDIESFLLRFLDRLRVLFNWCCFLIVVFSFYFLRLLFRYFSQLPV
jgi:hypothetical protein